MQGRYGKQQQGRELLWWWCDWNKSGGMSEIKAMVCLKHKSRYGRNRSGDMAKYDVMVWLKQG